MAGSARDRSEHRALIRRAGAAGTVLQMIDRLLPLQTKGSMAVIGPNAKTAGIMGGGPIGMPWVDDASAMIQAWNSRQECGNAIADVLMGNAEPGGRLP